MKKKLTITIGIPVFNEEENITRLIGSILSQKTGDYILKNIIIVSDGSKDNTVSLIKSIKNKKIKLISHKRRCGKPTRLNEILKYANSDITFLIDGDVLIFDRDLLNKIAKRINRYKNTDLLIANVKPLPAVTFIEKATSNFFFSREIAKTNIFNYRTSVYAARGGGIILSKKLAKRISYPSDILNDDAYSYLFAKKRDMKINFSDSIKVYFRAAQTIKDYSKQMERYMDGETQMHKHFSSEFVNKEYYVPKMYLVQVLINQLKKNFIQYMFLKIVNVYCTFKSHNKNAKTFKVTWESIHTSKKLII